MLKTILNLTCNLPLNVQDLGSQGPSGSDESAVLQHRLKYTPYCCHGNDPLLSIERYTHTMSSGVPAGPGKVMSSGVPAGPGKINVSITCSRNELPPLLTQHPHTATFQSLKVSRSVPPSREKKDILNATNEEELPPNSRSSSSAAVYESMINVGFKRGEVERAENKTLREAKATNSVKVLVSTRSGASIAPAGVRAVVTHRLRPITSNTMVKGKRMVTATR